jgi:hypothetical protein
MRPFNKKPQMTSEEFKASLRPASARARHSFINRRPSSVTVKRCWVLPFSSTLVLATTSPARTMCTNIMTPNPSSRSARSVQPSGDRAIKSRARWRGVRIGALTARPGQAETSEDDFNCGHLRQCAEAAGGVARPAPSRLDALKANPRTFPVRVDEFYSGGGQNACNRRHGPSVRLDFVIFEFANGQSCYAGLGR